MAVGDLSIVLVYVLVVLLEIIEVFYQAAESAILPEIISKDLLNEAMSLSKLDDGIVYVATPAIGTVMYKLFGVQGGFGRPRHFSSYLSYFILAFGHRIIFGVLTDLLPPYVNFAVAGSGIFICYLLYRRAFRYESQESFASEYGG